MNKGALTPALIEQLKKMQSIPLQGSDRWQSFVNELEKYLGCKLRRVDYIILHSIALQQHGDAFKVGRLQRQSPRLLPIRKSPTK